MKIKSNTEKQTKITYGSSDINAASFVLILFPCEAGNKDKQEPFLISAIVRFLL